jgi:hypothetical protein
MFRRRDSDSGNLTYEEQLDDQQKQFATDDQKPKGDRWFPGKILANGARALAQGAVHGVGNLATGATKLVGTLTGSTQREEDAKLIAEISKIHITKKKRSVSGRTLRKLFNETDSKMEEEDPTRESVTESQTEEDKSSRTTEPLRRREDAEEGRRIHELHEKSRTRFGQSFHWCEQQILDLLQKKHPWDVHKMNKLVKEVTEDVIRSLPVSGGVNGIGLYTGPNLFPHMRHSFQPTGPPPTIDCAKFISDNLGSHLKKFDLTKEWIKSILHGQYPSKKIIFFQEMMDIIEEHFLPFPQDLKQMVVYDPSAVQDLKWIYGKGHEEDEDDMESIWFYAKHCEDVLYYSLDKWEDFNKYPQELQVKLTSKFDTLRKNQISSKIDALHEEWRRFVHGEMEDEQYRTETSVFKKNQRFDQIRRGYHYVSTCYSSIIEFLMKTQDNVGQRNTWRERPTYLGDQPFNFNPISQIKPPRKEDTVRMWIESCSGSIAVELYEYYWDPHTCIIPFLQTEIVKDIEDMAYIVYRRLPWKYRYVYKTDKTDHMEYKKEVLREIENIMKEFWKCRTSIYDNSNYIGYLQEWIFEERNRANYFIWQLYADTHVLDKLSTGKKKNPNRKLSEKVKNTLDRIKAQNVTNSIQPEQIFQFLFVSDQGYKPDTWMTWLKKKFFLTSPVTQRSSSSRRNSKSMKTLQTKKVSKTDRD